MCASVPFIPKFTQMNVYVLGLNRIEVAYFVDYRIAKFPKTFSKKFIITGSYHNHPLSGLGKKMFVSCNGPKKIG